MRRLQRLILFAIAVMLAPIVPSTRATAQESGTAVVEGIVVNAVDGKPVAGIQVTLRAYFWRDRDFGGTLIEAIQNQVSPPQRPGRAPAPIVTDSAGRFVFRNVDANSYWLRISADGYAPYVYGQRVTGGQGALLYLASGETRNGLVLSVTPTGTVTGVVTKRSGGPVESAVVWILQPAYHNNGSRSMDVVATAQTNDRGEYRAYWVPPGRYFIRVRSSAAAGQYGFNGKPSPTLREAFDSDAYYPGVADIRTATAIQVGAGQERRDTNVVLDPVTPKTYRIRGRVVDSRTLQPPRRAALELSTIEPASQYASQTGADPVSGVFTLSGVAPGKYLLKTTTASYWGGVSSGNEDWFVTDLDGRVQTEIEVKDSDVTGVLMVLGNESLLTGQVSIEGSGLPVDKLQIQLRPVAGNFIIENRGGTGGVIPKQDGMFVLNNPLSGEHRLLLSDLPANAYVKSSKFGQIDLLTSPLRLSGPLTDNVNIVVSANAGSIQGVLQDTRRQPRPGLRAILIPNQRDRMDLYRTAISDYDGRFTIRGLPPGDYKVFSWEDIVPYAFFDPAFVARFEQNATAVRVAESSQANVEVTVLPPAEP